MKPFERVIRLIEIHLLIRNEETGTPIEAAKKFHVCRSQFYNIIDELKDYGAIIKYSRKYRTFYYENDFKITDTLFWKKEIKGFLEKKLSIHMEWTEDF
jgi:predicted DNA-binding transcriptional regulator YafY